MREFDQLRKVFAANAQLPATVTIPPGDDMGALDWPAESGELLVTVDQVAEGVHFSPGTSMDMVARKAIVRNVSDVAAMGCQPVAAVAAACLPRNLVENQVEALCDHLRQYAARYGCPLIGGDISVWDQPMVITVTVLARRWQKDIKPVLRSGAKAGDLIYVTGKLGGSFASGRHLSFEPRVDVARQLVMDHSGRHRPSAMIDLSDGLARDLGHVCEQSNVQALVEVARLPVHEDVAQWYPREEPWRHAMGDGEDYELCFTISPEAASLLPESLAGVKLTCIGRMHALAPGESESRNGCVMLVMSDGRLVEAGDLGWEHRS